VFNAVSLIEGFMYHSSLRTWSASGYQEPLSMGMSGLFKHVSSTLLRRSLCLEDVLLSRNLYSQQLMYIDVYSGPKIAPFSISLNLVNGHHPPTPSLNIDSYLFQLLNPGPTASWCLAQSSRRRLCLYSSNQPCKAGPT